MSRRSCFTFFSNGLRQQFCMNKGVSMTKQPQCTLEAKTGNHTSFLLI